MIKIKTICSYFLVFILLFSCSKKKRGVDLQLYQKGMIELKSGNFSKAGETFEQVEENEPFTTNAINGLVMSSYSYHKAKKYDESNRVIDYFIKINPFNENIEYLSYLKTMNYYDQIKSSLRSKDIIVKAYNELENFMKKYPHSIYLKDVQNKYVLTKSYLCENELKIGKFYLNNKNYMSAMEHFNTVINGCKKTKVYQESLYRSIQISFLLNLKFDLVKYYELMNSTEHNSFYYKKAIKLVNNYKKKNVKAFSI